MNGEGRQTIRVHDPVEGHVRLVTAPERVPDGARRSRTAGDHADESVGSDATRRNAAHHRVDRASPRLRGRRSHHAHTAASGAESARRARIHGGLLIVPLGYLARRDLRAGFMVGGLLLRSRLGIAAGLPAISATIQIALFVCWVRWGFVG